MVPSDSRFGGRPVIEGEIAFTIGGDQRVLGPGGTWRIPSNVPHSAEIGPDGAAVVDVFSPPLRDRRALAPTGARPLALALETVSEGRRPFGRP